MPRRWSAAAGLATALAAALLSAPRTAALDSLQFNGFALLRPQTPASGAPLDDNSLTAQIQLGADWRPVPGFGTHVHLLARNNEDGSRRGRVGIVEAYAEKVVLRPRDRVRVIAGAFFLPTSRENIDSLWETPYTISSSALNSWMGEEFRPIGTDVTYTHRTARIGSLTGGATLFGGNDTFGALPIDRGWALHDRWTLLGEHVPSGRFFTSVSAETDHRPGWSARGKWNNERGTVQFTRIDNRSDAKRYGELYNWATRFNIGAVDWTWNEWAFVAESGWGSTAIATRRGRFSSPIRASYLLVSRRVTSTVRASVRADEYKAGDDSGRALTAALFWEPRPKLRAGVEAITAQGQRRAAVELRYRF